MLERDGRGLPEVTSDELAQIGLADLNRSVLTAEGSIKAKRTFGSTAPNEVAREVQDAVRVLDARDRSTNTMELHS